MAGETQRQRCGTCMALRQEVEALRRENQRLSYQLAWTRIWNRGQRDLIKRLRTDMARYADEVDHVQAESERKGEG